MGWQRLVRSRQAMRRVRRCWLSKMSSRENLEPRRRCHQTIPVYLTACFSSVRLRGHLCTLLATPPTSITSVASFKRPPPTTPVMVLLIRRRPHPTAPMQLATRGCLVLDGHPLVHRHHLRRRHLHLQLNLPILFTMSKF